MTDPLEQQRARVEASREELRSSVDQFGEVAEHRRGELVERAREAAVPAVAALAGVALAALVLSRRRRRRSRALVEFGPFAVHPRR